MICCGHFQCILESCYWWRSWRKEFVKSVLLGHWTLLSQYGRKFMAQREGETAVGCSGSLTAGVVSGKNKKINTGHQCRLGSWIMRTMLIHLFSHWLMCHSSSFKGGRMLISKHAEVFIAEMIVCLSSCGKGKI